MALEQNLTAEEQAQMDAMRAADAQPGPEADAGAVQAPSSVQPATPDATEKTETEKPGAEAKKPLDVVPLKTFLEDRRKWEERLNEEKRARQTLEERTNLILQRIPQAQEQQKPPAETEIPALDKDPVGHIVGTMQQQGATMQQIMGALQEFGARTQQQNAISELQRRAAATEQEFRATNPDYDQAVAHLTADRHAELAEMGYSDPAMRQQIIANDALQIAHRAFEQGANPAERIYAMAKRRGYAPKAAPQTPPQQEQSAEERIRSAQAGQQQATSLGAARGAAPAPMTAQRLLQMSDAEVNDFIAKASPQQMAEMFGA